MSDSICTINLSSLKSIDDKLKTALDEKIQSWKQDYGKEKEPVTVLVQDAEDGKLFKLAYSKELSEELNRIEDGIAKNLLMSRVDVSLRPWKKKYESKVCFTIFIGLTEEQAKKVIGMAEKEEKKKPVLDIYPIEPKFSMEQVVLPEKTKEEIKDVIGLLQNMSKIYNDWGFKEIDPIPRSIVNLWGPPGTGKTTVIRAIVERFKEKFIVEENKKWEADKNYEPRSAEILITSCQNTAVDNAVKVEDVHAFPAYRVTSKSRPSKKYQQNY